ncbi:circularly permuted type 2 ATP-grasp protein [bacterium]|nr:circularly permuted type 2 ATP-grasp protein [bacterium]
MQSNFNEMYGAEGLPRTVYQKLHAFLKNLPAKELLKRAQHANMAFLTKGVTYTVYGDSSGLEKIIPFDIMPRILDAQEWDLLEKGLAQRIRALNLFLADIYHEQHIIRDGIIPSDLIFNNPLYRPEMKGVRVPGDVYISIAGIDIIRDHEGGYYVLEDNARCPSGVSYVLENREVMQKIFPELFNLYSVEPVSSYTRDLLTTLSSLMPTEVRPNIVLLTPGIFNSAYYEHAFLAANMGIQLVEGQDLVVKRKKVYMKTTCGLERIDVIYRRIDEDFLDPDVFRSDSQLGVPGLFECFKEGNVALANSIGTGIADDKAVYSFVPQMIKYYLNEKPLIANVETFLMRDIESREYVLNHLEEFVVKPTGGSGGYGMLIGSAASKNEREAFACKVLQNPEAYIAQKIIQLSCHPTFIGETSTFEPRHIDLRPFVLTEAGGDIRFLPGGLSRVALTRGSLVVNSSQGGGGKDTWVLRK